MEERMDFELYKSTVCHRVKDLGDLQFMINVLKNNEIRDLLIRIGIPSHFTYLP